MIGYIAWRLVQAVPLVLGILVLSFVLIHLAPGDPIYALAGQSGDAAYFAAMLGSTSGMGLASEKTMQSFAIALIADSGTEPPDRPR